MRFWHRIVAILMLALYAPGAVLAALPLVRCLADDGHQKIEWCTGSNCHGEPATTATADDAAGWLHVHDEGCTDTALMAPAQPRLMGAVVSLPKAIALPHFMSPASRPASLAAQDRTSHQVCPHVARLAQLRTVVLRI